MYKISEEAIKNIDEVLYEKFNVTYKEFKKLDYDKQKEIIKELNKERRRQEEISIGIGESVYIQALDERKSKYKNLSFSKKLCKRD